MCNFVLGITYEYKHNIDVLFVAFKPIHLAPRSDAPDEARGQIASPPVFVQLQELHTLSGDRAKYLDEITQETLKAKAETSLDGFEHFGTKEARLGNFIDRVSWITRTHDYVFYSRIVDNLWSFCGITS